MTSGHQRLVLPFLPVLVLAACGANSDGAVFSTALDAGSIGDASPSNFVFQFVETFDARSQMLRLQGAVLDTNRGWLTLDGESFPKTPEAMPTDFTSLSSAESGLIEANRIELPEGTDLEATDALELRAQESVILRGTIRVGRGGLIISAGRRIELHGEIESSGPIELFVAQPGGSLRIGGKITTGYGVTSALQVRSRGLVRLSGEISADENPQTAIDVVSSGEVELADLQAPSSSIHTTSKLTIIGENQVTDLAIEAQDLTLDPWASLTSERLQLTSTSTLTLLTEAQIETGACELSATSLRLDPQSILQVSRLQLSVAQDLSANQSSIRGPTFGCAASSQIVARVGGSLSGSGFSVIGFRERSSECRDETEPSVIFEAARLLGEAPEIIGAGNSSFQIVENPVINLPEPDDFLRGSWISQPFSVPAGSTPFVTDVALLDGTIGEVRISLGKLDANAEWVAGDSQLPIADGEDVSVLIELMGSTFDVPRLDRVAITWQ